MVRIRQRPRVREAHADDIDGVVRLWQSVAGSGGTVYSLAEVIASCREDVAIVAVVGEEVVGAAVGVDRRQRTAHLDHHHEAQEHEREVGDRVVGCSGVASGITNHTSTKRDNRVGSFSTPTYHPVVYCAHGIKILTLFA